MKFNYHFQTTMVSDFWFCFNDIVKMCTQIEDENYQRGKEK